MKTTIKTAATLAAATLLTLGACGPDARSDTSSAVMTKGMQTAMTPDEVIAALKAGNKRFVNDRLTERDYLSQAEKTAGGQYPHTIVLSCLDSRVPPEIVFDQGIGDIFVGRVAGNFENTDMLGSMEFGTAVAGAKVILVLGHTSCGAVKGTIDRAELGNLTATLANIEPAVVATSTGPRGRTSKDTDYVNRVVETNVEQTIRDIRSRSSVLAGLEREGKLKIIGGVYDLETGRVAWMD